MKKIFSFCISFFVSRGTEDAYLCSIRHWTSARRAGCRRQLVVRSYAYASLSEKAIFAAPVDTMGIRYYRSYLSGYVYRYM